MAMGFNSEIEIEKNTECNAVAKPEDHPGVIPITRLDVWSVTVDTNALEEGGAYGDILLKVVDNRGASMILILNRQVAKDMSNALKAIAKVSKLNNKVYC